MAPTETLITFFVAALFFAYLPGPALLYTAAQTLARGRRAGFMAALGIHLGCYVHVAAAAAGLSAIFHAVPVLYLTVKLAGAAYLVWLGIGLIRTPPPPTDIALPTGPASPYRALREAVIVEILNPKVALFFLALLPQFVDPSAALPVWLQFLILGTVVNMTFTSADLVCVTMAGAVAARLRRSARAQRIARRLGGGVLVGLGLHLGLGRAA